MLAVPDGLLVSHKGTKSTKVRKGIEMECCLGRLDDRCAGAWQGSGVARTFMMLSGVLGALAVGMGAFGAHGLRGKLEGLEDGVKRLGWWETAAQYHLMHAVALGLVAFVVSKTSSGVGNAAGYAFVGGALIFSGSLYAMALGGPRWLGAITPIGGLALIVGWVLLAIAGWKGLA